MLRRQRQQRLRQQIRLEANSSMNRRPTRFPPLPVSIPMNVGAVGDEERVAVSSRDMRDDSGSIQYVPRNVGGND